MTRLEGVVQPKLIVRHTITQRYTSRTQAHAADAPAGLGKRNGCRNRTQETQEIPGNILPYHRPPRGIWYLASVTPERLGQSPGRPAG